MELCTSIYMSVKMFNTTTKKSTIQCDCVKERRYQRTLICFLFLADAEHSTFVFNGSNFVLLDSILERN